MNEQLLLIREEDIAIPDVVLLSNARTSLQAWVDLRNRALSDRSVKPYMLDRAADEFQVHVRRLGNMSSEVKAVVCQITINRSFQVEDEDVISHRIAMAQRTTNTFGLDCTDDGQRLSFPIALVKPHFPPSVTERGHDSLDRSAAWVTIVLNPIDIDPAGQSDAVNDTTTITVIPCNIGTNHGFADHVLFQFGGIRLRPEEIQILGISDAIPDYLKGLRFDDGPQDGPDLYTRAEEALAG